MTQPPAAGPSGLEGVPKVGDDPDEYDYRLMSDGPGRFAHRNRIEHMGLANTVVEKILTSPAHRILSGSTVLIRYQGRRSGTEYTTPVQYADAHVGLVVLVGKPETKTWWRNFTDMGQLTVLLAGKWIPMTAHTLRGVDDPDAVEPLLRSYSIRFPKVVKSLDGDTLDDRVRGAVVVWLRPA